MLCIQTVRHRGGNGLLQQLDLLEASQARGSTSGVVLIDRELGGDGDHDRRNSFVACERFQSL